MTSTRIQKWIMLSALSCFAGTALAGIAETGRDAIAGEESAQRELAARYASGNDVVKDALLSEQWLLRADLNMSARSGGDALAALRKRQEGALARAEKETKATDRDTQPASQKENAAHKKPLPLKKAASLKAPATKARAENVAAEKDAETPVRIELDDFQMLLRAASQGNRAALETFRTDAKARDYLANYAKTAEGKRNPFVREVVTRLKNK